MQVWMGVIRHLLTVAGGGLMAKGYVDSGTWEALTGGAVALLGVIWSVAQKKGWVS